MRALLRVAESSNRCPGCQGRNEAPPQGVAAQTADPRGPARVAYYHPAPMLQVTGRDGAARTGVLSTPHGGIRTPAFMPVATLGAVKGVAPEQLAALGADVMLCNLYHLSLRPGVAAIEGLGGLHAFTGWRGPLLTDSGGFQVWSLGHLRRVDEEGVTFRNHLDGAPSRLTPEGVVDLQRRLGVDVAMVLDECPPWPVTE